MQKTLVYAAIFSIAPHVGAMDTKNPLHQQITRYSRENMQSSYDKPKIDILCKELGNRSIEEIRNITQKNLPKTLALLQTNEDIQNPMGALIIGELLNTPVTQRIYNDIWLNVGYDFNEEDKDAMKKMSAPALLLRVAKAEKIQNFSRELDLVLHTKVPSPDILFLKPGNLNTLENTLQKFDIVNAHEISVSATEFNHLKGLPDGILERLRTKDGHLLYVCVDNTTIEKLLTTAMRTGACAAAGAVGGATLAVARNGCKNIGQQAAQASATAVNSTLSSVLPSLIQKYINKSLFNQDSFNTISNRILQEELADGPTELDNGEYLPTIIVNVLTPATKEYISESAHNISNIQHAKEFFSDELKKPVIQAATQAAMDTIKDPAITLSTNTYLDGLSSTSVVQAAGYGALLGGSYGFLKSLYNLNSPVVPSTPIAYINQQVHNPAQKALKRNKNQH